MGRRSVLLVGALPAVGSLRTGRCVARPLSLSFPSLFLPSPSFILSPCKSFVFAILRAVSAGVSPNALSGVLRQTAQPAEPLAFRKEGLRLKIVSLVLRALVLALEFTNFLRNLRAFATLTIQEKGQTPLFLKSSSVRLRRRLLALSGFRNCPPGDRG